MEQENIQVEGLWLECPTLGVEKYDKETIRFVSFGYIYIFDSHCHLDYMVSKLNKSRTWSQDDSGIRIYIQDLQWMGRE